MRPEGQGWSLPLHLPEGSWGEGEAEGGEGWVGHVEQRHKTSRLKLSGNSEGAGQTVSTHKHATRPFNSQHL